MDQSESKSGLSAFSQHSPLQLEQAGLHSNPTFLQLQASVLHPVWHVHLTTFMICAGAGSLSVAMGHSLSFTLSVSTQILPCDIAVLHKDSTSWLK